MDFLIKNLHPKKGIPELVDLLESVQVDTSKFDWSTATCNENIAGLVWLDVVLTARQPIGARDQRLLLRRYGSRLGEVFKEVLEAVNNKLARFAVYTLTIADSTFVGLSGEKTWLDLRNGQTVEKLPHVPIEATTYNLNSLFIEFNRLYQQRVTSNAERDTPKPSSPG